MKQTRDKKVYEINEINEKQKNNSKKKIRENCC